MEKEILNAFLYDNELKFSEIEKKINEKNKNNLENKNKKIRSNKLAYHLNSLVKKRVLVKEIKKEKYKLSKTSETLIPYISEKKSPLPVILIIVKKNSDQIFMHKRKKRPFKNKLSLPGGRIKQGESINEATKRILMEKHKIKGNIQKINSISLEHTYKKNLENEKIHSFILILVTASTSNKINYTTISKNKKEIISSDYNLMKNNLNKKTNIEEFWTKY